jgi:hypothetical protein
MIYAGPFTFEDAARVRGVAYPMPHSSVVGVEPADLRTHPERYAATQLTAPERDRGGADYFVRVLDEMAALPDDGDGDVMRDGTERVLAEIDDEIEVVERVRL